MNVAEIETGIEYRNVVVAFIQNFIVAHLNGNTIFTKNFSLYKF